MWRGHVLEMVSLLWGLPKMFLSLPVWLVWEHTLQYNYRILSLLSRAEDQLIRPWLARGIRGWGWGMGDGGCQMIRFFWKKGIRMAVRLPG